MTKNLETRQPTSAGKVWNIRVWDGWRPFCRSLAFRGWSRSFSWDLWIPARLFPGTKSTLMLLSPRTSGLLDLEGSSHSRNKLLPVPAALTHTPEWKAFSLGSHLHHRQWTWCQERWTWNQSFVENNNQGPSSMCPNFALTTMYGYCDGDLNDSWLYSLCCQHELCSC